MSKKETLRRYAVFILGLFFAGVGIAFTKHSDLGVSPISSVANIMSIKFPVMTLGSWLIIWNCILILAQIAILGRNFKLYQLFQVPLSFLFGWFTDFGMWLASFFPVTCYAAKLVILFAGILLLAFGVSLAVIANVIMNSGEAVVKAIADAVHKEFGYVKVSFDVACVVMSVLLSVIFFKGQILGTREGTIISALLTGLVVKFITKHIDGPVTGAIEYHL